MAELAPLDDQHGETAAGYQQGEKTSTEVRVVDALSTRTARSIEDVAARAGLSLAEVQAELGTLQVDGTAREGDRGWTVRPRPKTPVSGASGMVVASNARQQSNGQTD